MIGAIVEAVAAAKEVTAGIESCRISLDVMADIKEMLKNLTGEVSDVSATAAEGEASIASSEAETATNASLEANAEYVKSGHFYETNDAGEIIKKDGEYLTSYEERLKRTPVNGERGNWEGERGESKYTPDVNNEKGARAAEKLSEYGLDGIEYRDGIPDFAECAEESVEIEMTENIHSIPDEGIIGNYEKADTECAKKWNEMRKDGRDDWTPRDIANYRSANKMSWHECSDRKTCQLVHQDIHLFFKHAGGRMECGKEMMQDLGGLFDE